MGKDNTVKIRGKEGSIDLGVTGSEAARRLGIGKQRVRNVLGGIGVRPLHESPRMHLYNPDKIESVRRLREAHPPESGKKWNPPQELLDRFDLP